MSTIDRRTLIRNTVVAAAALATPLAAMSAAQAMSATEYRKHDALALAKLVRSGQITPRELLEIAIARAEAVNPSLNCIVEKLYERARESVAAGLPAGPFAGVPFLLVVEGM